MARERVIDLTLDQLRELIAETRPVETPYYTQDTSPLNRSLHMALVRSGVIAGHKVGRNYYARRADVHAYIESHPATSGAPGVETEVDQMLAKAGM